MAEGVRTRDPRNTFQVVPTCLVEQDPRHHKDRPGPRDLRSLLGDNQSATDLRILGVEEMIDELFDSARNKAALLAQVFSGQKIAPDSFEMSDSHYTRERLTPLFSRLLKANLAFQAGHIGDAELIALGTDGVASPRALEPKTRISRSLTPKCPRTRCAKACARRRS